MGTALCSKLIPEHGGNTAFASMSAVYEGLSDRWQRFFSGLEAVHDFKPFRSLFPTDADGIEKLRRFEDRYPAVTHPVVSVHPITGKKVIFVNPQFTLYIKGMAEDETPPATPKHIEGQRAPDATPVSTPTAEHDKL